MPPGFVLSTQLCRDYLKHGAGALDGIDEVLVRELDHLAALTGRCFGDASRPLLVSARSGAAVSMPGMMETVLNIGLTDETLRGLVRMTGIPASPATAAGDWSANTARWFTGSRRRDSTLEPWNC